MKSWVPPLNVLSMQGYIGYIRVSTVKQGTQGVSLQEQKDAILRYANRNRFTVSHWQEEMVTAGKQGRPVFNHALKLLRTGKAKGIILHKLDRGARNLRDWATIGELSDQGVEVHFVTESLDLQSRGGRLSADIQAVVAADFIRNLREETRKGMYGRLKQGIYPLAAPIGYLDQGKGGKVKIIDPVRGPLIRKAFELYATGRYNLHTLTEELYRLGLRNRRDKKVPFTSLSHLLNNPFYMGIIRLKKSGETFNGIHEPLVSEALFQRVQDTLSGKVFARPQKHAFLYRRMLACAGCGYSLIGERQKGHVYYRCHSKKCRAVSIREEHVEAAFLELYDRLSFTEEETNVFRALIQDLRKTWVTDRQGMLEGLRLRQNQTKDRLSRLTDAYLDAVLDKSMFEQRKEVLLHEQRALAEKLADLETNRAAWPDELEKNLELARNARLSHEMGLPEEKREMARIITSNRVVSGKNLVLEPANPFAQIARRSKTESCALQRNRPRTLGQILDNLIKLNKTGNLTNLDALPCRQ